MGRLLHEAVSGSSTQVLSDVPVEASGQVRQHSLADWGVGCFLKRSRCMMNVYDTV